MKKTVSLLLTVLLSLSYLATQNTFAAPIFSENVAPFLAELKIMQGDPDGNLRLENAVSRAECAKIIVAASSFRNMVAAGSKTSPFRDVPADHWAAPYITVAVRNGLCKGYLDATFRPSNTVSFEEALTMFLRVLGYSEEDFGPSWPDGQIGIAQNIGLCDELHRSVGEALTRRDIMTIVYNMLNTPAKNAGNDYLSNFDRTIIDDVILIASENESASVDAGKVATSAGTYKITENFNFSDIGKRGSITVRNNDTVVSFIPNHNSAGSHISTVVYSVLGNNIVTYSQGAFGKITLTSDTVFYEDNVKTTYSAIANKIEMGDVLKVNHRQNGNVDYVVYSKGNMVGPVTIQGTSWHASLGADPETTAVMRDGVKVASSGLKTNDIAYYSKDLDMILAYSKKVTGVYESASPNNDAPVSVTVSGKTYDLEGINAFTKLSSSGNFRYGDTVTLLLGKSGDVADVVSQSQQTGTVYGYLIETGTKETTVNGTSVTKPYARLILPSGESVEYITTKDYKSVLNHPVKVSFKNGVAQIATLSTQSSVSGKFIWNDSTKTLGNTQLDDNVKILEVSTISSSARGKASSVFPQRLSGMTLGSGSIFYAGKNSEGKITELIIDDTTGDMHAYGIVLSAKKNTSGMNLSGTYTYLVNGTEKTISTSGSAYSVANGQPVKIETSETGSVTSMSPLTKIGGGTVSDITEETITYNGTAYKLYDRMAIYTRDASYNYSLLTIDEFRENYKNYTISLYSDKTNSANTLVRIILAIPK